jgi:hypothetical protein
LPKVPVFTATSAFCALIDSVMTVSSNEIIVFLIVFMKVVKIVIVVSSAKVAFLQGRGCKNKKLV